MPDNQQSPAYVRTSLAGAMCLGLEPGRFLRGARCTCLNILLTYQDGCRGACSYCGLARTRQAAASRTFIRVPWPMYPVQTIIDKFRTVHHPFKRLCVSMITHPRCVADTCWIMEEFRKISDIPISGLVTPTVLRGKADLAAIRDAGADRVGIAVDAATPALFARHRGRGVGGPHQWERYWQTVAEAVDVFGRYNVGVHLIVGLGETERDMVNAIARAHEMGALTHLFSFFPEAGSQLANAPQPPLAQYRRVQLARYLINEGIISAAAIRFSPQGKIKGYGRDITPYIEQGLAFMTSGCPGADGFVACNRPFGNERASEPLRNYPFIPTAEDIATIRAQLEEETDHAGVG